MPKREFQSIITVLRCFWCTLNVRQCSQRTSIPSWIHKWPVGICFRKSQVEDQVLLAMLQLMKKGLEMNYIQSIINFRCFPRYQQGNEYFNDFMFIQKR